MDINGFEIEVYNIYKIPEKAKTHTCPKCSEHRKKKKDKCMSVFWDTGLGQCNHCGETTQLHTYKKKQETKVYIKPNKVTVNENYSTSLQSYISSRKINLNALERLKVTEQKEWMPQTKKQENCICFNYYLENELINVKYRDGKKNFKLFKGAEKIFYNLDSIATSKEAIIVEGEFDVLAYATANINNVVSVPNGFNLKGDHVNLDYLDNYTEYFENKDTIYIAVDNDDAGIKGQKELVRRLGADKCKLVDFKDCKDANDYLIKYGSESLKDTIKKAKDVKIEGVFYANDVKDSMLNSYRNGQKRGTTTYVDCVDKAWTWRPGEVNLWTGYQNEGKSLMLNQLCLIRAKNEDAKVAVFSPENFPLDDFYTDLIEMEVGKSADPYYKNNYMSEDEFKESFEFVNNNFFSIYPKKDFKLESLFERIKYLVKKKGIRTVIIDPYNTVEHMMKPGEREDLYISRFISTLKRFAVDYDLSMNLVAHQNTPKKNDKDDGRYFKPQLNNIKGGGTFADKADNVLITWRPNRAIDFRCNQVIFSSQKIKKQKLVGYPQDVDYITFNIRTNRYCFNGENPLEDKEEQFEQEKQIQPATLLEAFGDEPPF
mgnify:CR=1 FL=1